MLQFKKKLSGINKNIKFKKTKCMIYSMTKTVQRKNQTSPDLPVSRSYCSKKYESIYSTTLYKQ